MLHGVRLRDGRAEWYRNRWVRTRRSRGAPFRPDRRRPHRRSPPTPTSSRTPGGSWRWSRAACPYELTPELDTVGPCDFGGRLTTAMTAHPKTDPVTGELHFFGYGAAAAVPDLPPALDADGRARARSAEIAVAGADDDARLRDHRPVTSSGSTCPWCSTRRCSARDALRLGRRLRRAARRDAAGRPAPTVRWFDVDPCYVFHVGNAIPTTRGPGRARRRPLRAAPTSVAMWDGSAPRPRRHAAAAADRCRPAAPLDARPGDRRRDARRRSRTGPSSSRPSTTSASGRDARYRYAVTDTGDAAGDRQVRRRDGRASPSTRVGAETRRRRGGVRARAPAPAAPRTTAGC